MCRTIQTPDLVALGKIPERCIELNTLLTENRKQTEQQLIKLIGKGNALNALRYFETAVVRLAMAKSQKRDFPTGVAGKFESEKLKTIHRSWHKWLHATYPCLSDLARSVGITIETEAVADLGGDDVSLIHYRDLLGLHVLHPVGVIFLFSCWRSCGSLNPGGVERCARLLLL